MMLEIGVRVIWIVDDTMLTHECVTEPPTLTFNGRASLDLAICSDANLQIEPSKKSTATPTNYISSNESKKPFDYTRTHAHIWQTQLQLPPR